MVHQVASERGLVHIWSSPDHICSNADHIRSQRQAVRLVSGAYNGTVALIKKEAGRPRTFPAVETRGSPLAGRQLTFTRGRPLAGRPRTFTRGSPLAGRSRTFPAVETRASPLAGRPRTFTRGSPRAGRPRTFTRGSPLAGRPRTFPAVETRGSPLAGRQLTFTRGSPLAGRPRTFTRGSPLAGRPRTFPAVETRGSPLAGRQLTFTRGSPLAGRPRTFTRGSPLAGRPRTSTRGSPLAGRPRTFTRGSPLAGRPRQKENFRQLKIVGVHEIKERIQRTRFQRVRQPPRHLKMKVDQDWTNVWPTAHSFKWSVVPFPVRQGHVKNLAENEGMIPEKYGNLELMKIPNFLHLTPIHIKKQCQALKELCTPWPEGLEGNEINRLFPLESQTNDYCLQFNVGNLKLTKAAKRKFVHLVGDRYDSVNNEVTLTSDRCPLKAQNFDYIMYLITVLYHESSVKEAWEDEITLEDMSRIPWKLSSSRKNLRVSSYNNINIKVCHSFY
ncbi:small subunit ribosomal protein S35 [Mytilus galloprovincialis]|uniref:Small subunit ribosomal protein S35 n=1 Tax=Mytilus galloprovincialis TaxID=29158 RepID=A0A8B6HDS1_MYTGA|nr:small subunit ribosomal protein S35 [Mytilus galloprovincialis]